MLIGATDKLTRINMEDEATVRDLQTSLMRVTEDRDRWKEICYSLARYHAKDSDKTVFEVIEEEASWIRQQAEWNETGHTA